MNKMQVDSTDEQKRNAYLAVSRAIRAKILKNPGKCAKCKKPSKVSAHHSDYSKPLNVMWLCSWCHSDWHRENPQPQTELIRQILSGAVRVRPAVRKVEMTKREQEVLRLVCAGYSNQQIAHQLVISSRTVETHRERILKFADVHNAVQLAGWALKHDYIKPELLWSLVP